MSQNLSPAIAVGFAAAGHPPRQPEVPGQVLRVDEAHRTGRTVNSPPLDAIVEPCPHHAGEGPKTDDSGLVGRRDLPDSGERTGPCSVQSGLDQREAELERRERLLHGQLADFEKERRAFRLHAQEQNELLEERLARAEEVRGNLANRMAEAARWEQELRDSVRREKETLQEEQRKFEESRQRRETELAAVQAAAQEQLARDRAELESDLLRMREELRQEQALIDGRQRFQQDHLQRTMREFEQTQRDFRFEQQQVRARLVEAEALLQLRGRQLDRLREVLLAGQQALDREKQWLQVERRAVEGRIREDRDDLRTQRANWVRAQARQQAELQQRQDLLRLDADTLESRRRELDLVQAEVEQSRRETLEAGLEIAEVAAQLTQTFGGQPVAERLEEARRLLAEHYRHTRDSLSQQRQELEQLRTSLQEQWASFVQERRALADWVTQLESDFATREEARVAEREVWEARDEAWREAGERWTRDRLEAETVIRQLLGQLEVAAGR